MGPLVRKELRALRPWIVLGVVFTAIDVVEHLLSRPVLPALGDSFRRLSGENAGILWVWAFAIGTTLGTREADDGTLAFLDGLPVTRHRVFFVKWLVAAGVLFTWPALRAGLAVASHLAARGSLDHAVHADLLLQLLGLELLVVVSGLSLGAVLGFLRSLTWLVLGCASVGVGLLTERVPHAAVLDPMTLARVEVMGTRLHVDAEALAVQAALSVLCTVVAWAAFLGPGRPRFPDLSKRPVVSAVVSLLTVVAVLGAFALRYDLGDRPPSEGGGGGTTAGASETPKFPRSAPASTRTAHYRFSYPANRAREALALADGADEIFLRVHQLLRVPPGDPIDVDASGSLRSTLGTAFADGLRLKLGGAARAVLAHETSHVVARRLAGGERDWLWERATVLDEGLAVWVERRISGRTGDRQEDRLVLAALHRRGELRLEELVDGERLAKMRDEQLKYTAGEALIDATVRLYGEDAVARLLRAFADERLPQDTSGLALWQACFQLAGFDLGRVVDDFYREVEEEARARADELAALPRPRVVLVTSGGRYGAKAVLDRPLPKDWTLRLRFRPAPDSGLASYDTYQATPGVPHWRMAKDIRKAQLCVQAGVHLPHGNTLYEPWACLPVRDAEPWTGPDGAATGGAGEKAVRALEVPPGDAGLPGDEPKARAGED
jgi:hypothetical protein